MTRRCSHEAGGAERCRYCNRRTCPTCHHSREHLDRCPMTRQRETR